MSNQTTNNQNPIEMTPAVIIKAYTGWMKHAEKVYGLDFINCTDRKSRKGIAETVKFFAWWLGNNDITVIDCGILHELSLSESYLKLFDILDLLNG